MQIELSCIGPISRPIAQYKWFDIWKVRRPKPSHSIPTLLGREAGHIAPNGRPASDIGESFVSPRVEERIEEAQNRLTCRDQGIVHEREDASSGGAGGAGTIEKHHGTIPDSNEALALGWDVGVAAASSVVKTAEFRAKAGNVRWDDRVLICRAGEVVGESSSRSKVIPGIERCDFRVDILGSTHRCDIGAAIGKRGKEHRGIFAVVGETFAARADPAITTGAEEGDASCTELGELVADWSSVGEWDSLFIITIGGADDLGYVLLGKDVLQPC